MIRCSLTTPTHVNISAGPMHALFFRNACIGKPWTRHIWSNRLFLTYLLRTTMV